MTKTRIMIAGLVALNVLTSQAFAGDLPLPDPSDQLLPPPAGVGGTLEPGVIKNRNQCPEGAAFFKNAFPSLTNGMPGGSKTIDFTVDGKIIPMTVTWAADNSFGFEITGGAAHWVGVTVDTNNFIYKYATPVSSDANQNSYSGVIGADVNHLDLCLVAKEITPPDTTAPQVTITSPTDGATVAGPITVTATASDNVGLNSVTASVDGPSLSAPISLDPYTFTAPDQYSWDFDPAGLPTGIYTITVLAADTATPTANTTTVQVGVEVIIAASSCVGTIGDEDQDPTQPGDPYEGGCQPTIVNIQVPPDNNFNDGPDGCDALNGEICTITGVLLKPDPLVVANLAATGDCPACNVCPADSFPDVRQRYIEPGTDLLYPDGGWVPKQPLTELYVFQTLGLSDDSPYQDPQALLLNQYTYGFPCIVVARHFRNFPLKFGFATWPALTGLAFIKTHFPELVLSDELLPKCYGVGGNFDLQEANQGGYQTPNRSLMFGATAAVLTEMCFNPPRTLTRDKSYDISGIVETAGIPFDPDDPVASLNVLDFKVEMATLAFDALFFDIDNAAAAVDEFGSPCLISGKMADITKWANQARAQFDKFNVASLNRAIADLTTMVDVVSRRQVWCVINENYAGSIIAQGNGLIYRVTQIRDELIRIESLPN